MKFIIVVKWSRSQTASIDEMLYPLCLRLATWVARLLHLITQLRKEGEKKRERERERETERKRDRETERKRERERERCFIGEVNHPRQCTAQCDYLLAACAPQHNLN